MGEGSDHSINNQKMGDKSAPAINYNDTENSDNIQKKFENVNQSVRAKAFVELKIHYMEENSPNNELISDNGHYAQV